MLSLIAFSDGAALLGLSDGTFATGDNEIMLLGVAVESSVPAFGKGVGFAWLVVGLVIITGMIVVGLAVVEELLTVGCLPDATEDVIGDENNGVILADTTGGEAVIGLAVVGEPTTGARMLIGAETTGA